MRHSPGRGCRQPEDPALPHSQIHSQGARSQEANSPDSSSASRPPRRLGPRPLPQHLMLALALWGNSAAAWPSLKAAWQNSNAAPANQGAKGQPSQLASALQALAPGLDKADEAALVEALTSEGHRRLGRFLDG